MKKLISVLIILSLAISTMCVGVSAAGEYMNFNCDSEEYFAAQFMPGAFYVDEPTGMLYGYNDAKSLQSMYSNPDGIFDNTLNTWLTYDASITLSFATDDLVTGDRYVSLSYVNDNPWAKGMTDSREFIVMSYDITNERFLLTSGAGPNFNGDEALLAEPVAMDLDTEGESFYTFGMSVSKNRVRFFLDNELIFDYDGTEKLVADTINSPLMFWNDRNFINIKNITVAKQGYLFPVTDVPESSDTATPAPDESTTAATTPKETSETTTKIVEEIVTNDKGETSVVTKIETETTTTTVAPADTNTAAPVGGNAASTGDASLAVIAAMIVTLGCALVVRKAIVK